MKYIFVIGVVIVLLITLRFSFLEESQSGSEKSHSAKLNENEDSKLRLQLHAQHGVHTSELAFARNEFIARSLPMTFDDFVFHEIDDHENGTFYLKEVFAALETKDTSAPAFKLKKLSEKSFDELSDEERKELSEVLNNPEVISLFMKIEQATKQENFSWNLDYSKGLALSMPHLIPIRMLQRVQNINVEYLLFEGKNQEAQKALAVGLKSASMTSEGMTIIEELVQTANFSIISQNIPQPSHKTV